MPEDTAGRIWKLALDILARRRYTRHELLARLVRRGVPAAEAEAAVARLQELGYIDDWQYGADLAAVRLGKNPVGPRRLADELRRKGLDPDVTRQVLDHALACQDEQALAMQAAQARWPRLSHLPPDESRRKLAGYLQRRGFSWQAVSSVLQRLTGADPGIGET